MEDHSRWGLATDTDPGNPNPHAWELAETFTTEEDAQKAADLMMDTGRDDRGWLVVDLSRLTKRP